MLPLFLEVLIERKKWSNRGKKRRERERGIMEGKGNTRNCLNLLNFTPRVTYCCKFLVLGNIAVNKGTAH